MNDRADLPDITDPVLAILDALDMEPDDVRSFRVKLDSIIVTRYLRDAQGKKRVEYGIATLEHVELPVITNRAREQARADMLADLLESA